MTNYNIIHGRTVIVTEAEFSFLFLQRTTQFVNLVRGQLTMVFDPQEIKKFYINSGSYTQAPLMAIITNSSTNQ